MLGGSKQTLPLSALGLSPRPAAVVPVLLPVAAPPLPPPHPASHCPTPWQPSPQVRIAGAAVPVRRVAQPGGTASIAALPAAMVCVQSSQAGEGPKRRYDKEGQGAPRILVKILSSQTQRNDGRTGRYEAVTEDAVTLEAERDTLKDAVIFDWSAALTGAAGTTPMRRQDSVFGVRDAWRGRQRTLPIVFRVRSSEFTVTSTWGNKSRGSCRDPRYVILAIAHE